MRSRNRIRGGLAAFLVLLCAPPRSVCQPAVLGQGGETAALRPVHDASSWAAVDGPLRPLWSRWKAEQAAAGTMWDDQGHITNIQGARITASRRADQVPPAFTAWAMQHAGDEGLLLGSSPADAAARAAAEAARVQVLVQQAAQKVAEEEAAARAAAERAAPEAAADPAATDPAATGEQPADAEADATPEGDPAGFLPAADSPGASPADAFGEPTTQPGADSTGGDMGLPSSDTTGGPPPATAKPAPEKDLAYGTEHGLQKLDLYLPPDAGGAVPLVVYFHGGGFYRGDKGDVGKFLAVLDHGYALASVNYRLLQKGSVADVNLIQDVGTIAKAAFDCRLAVRWLRSNAGRYGLDPDRFAAAGASAGGYMAAVVGSGSDVGRFPGEPGGGPSAAVRAVIDWAGVTNFGTFVEHKGGSSFGGLASSFLSAQGALSPYEYVSGGDPPTQIRHGEADPVVPVKQSTTYAARLKQAGVEVDLETFPGLGHEPDPAFLQREVEAAIAFLDRALR